MQVLVYGEPMVPSEVPVPVAGPGETLVSVSRAAVNPLDIWTSRGSVGGGLPRTLGVEGAGTTADGRRVFFRGSGLGISRDGSYAEQVVVPDEALTPIPDGVSDAAAAGIGVAGVTALDVLDLAGVGAGSRVLVLGASGGVGSVACQLARARGARVIAQTSSAARAAGLAAEADQVAVAGADGLEAAVGDRVDAVLDPLGGAFTGAAVRLLAPGGCIVVFGASAGPEFTIVSTQLYRNRGRLLGYGGIGESAADLSRKAGILMAEVAAGRLRPVIAAELPLADANEAHRRLLTREAGGKLLLVP
jgi:NADPH2:quinone reductase